VSVVLRLFRHVSWYRRFKCMLLSGVMLISALAEIVSLGAVLPFLAALSAPEKVFDHPALAGFVQGLGITTAGDLMLPLTILFATAALTAGGIRVLLMQESIRFAFGTGADFSIEAYRRALYQPYHVHLSRNTSEVISGIIQKVGTATHVLLSMVTLASSAVLFAAIILALFAIDTTVTTVAAIGLGASYALITALSRHRLERNSQRIAQEQIQVVKALQEGLGGIRDVLLDGTQSAYSDIYRKADQPLREALADNLFVSMRPRYVMEAIGMALIAALAYATSRQAGGSKRLFQYWARWRSARNVRCLLCSSYTPAGQPLLAAAHP
jgi:ATP-binding cassette subfamily B protein